MKNFKKILKNITPPILLNRELVNFLKRNFNKKDAWKYSSDFRKIIRFDYDEIDLENEKVWESPNWLNSQKEGLIKNFEKEPSFQIKTTLFAIKVLYFFNSNDVVKIIDFGGGCGTLVPFLKKFSKETKIKLKTISIDSERNIEIGKNILGEDKNLMFYKDTQKSLKEILKEENHKGESLLLNMSGVLQYIHPYKDFLKDILADKIPKLVCITRFNRCEDAFKDAFTIQDVVTEFGKCGSTKYNLFAKFSLEEVMRDLGYELLKEEFISLGGKRRFSECEDETYRRFTTMACIFVRK